jgi:hypothetical protein
MDKLRQYIREYVMYLYNLKSADGIEDYQYRHPGDIEHPIQPDDYDSNNKLPLAFTRRRSFAMPHFENKK